MYICLVTNKRITMERRPPKPTEWELKAMDIKACHEQQVKQIHDYAREFSIMHKCRFIDALSYAESFYKDFDEWEKDLEEYLRKRIVSL